MICGCFTNSGILLFSIDALTIDVIIAAISSKHSFNSSRTQATIKVGLQNRPNVVYLIIEKNVKTLVKFLERRMWWEYCVTAISYHTLRKPEQFFTITFILLDFRRNIFSFSNLKEHWNKLHSTFLDGFTLSILLLLLDL